MNSFILNTVLLSPVFLTRFSNDHQPSKTSRSHTDSSWREQLGLSCRLRQMCHCLQIRRRGRGLADAGGPDSAGKSVTGSVIIDEACHMLRVSRDLRGKQQMVDDADALLVMACGAGIQSVSAATPKKTVAALDSMFLGNISRFGQFEQKCSLCGECILTETAGICPVTACPKGLLNGPCGGMDAGRCETDPEAECAWAADICQNAGVRQQQQSDSNSPPEKLRKDPQTRQTEAPQMTGQPSHLQQKLSQGEFVITAEVCPPKGCDCALFVHHAKALSGTVDAINVTDNQGANMRISPLAASACCCKPGLNRSCS